MELLEKMDEALAVRTVEQSVTDAARNHCMGAFYSLSESLAQAHVTLQKMQKKCEQDRLVLGTFTEAREKGLKDAGLLKESLFKCVEN
jgi:regulator of nonsense transcripts 2